MNRIIVFIIFTKRCPDLSFRSLMSVTCTVQQADVFKVSKSALNTQARLVELYQFSETESISWDSIQLAN
jgi:hypothetical protein